MKSTDQSLSRLYDKSCPASPIRYHLSSGLFKAQTNRGIKPTLHFLRDKEGHKIDAIIQTGPDTFHAVEIKSGETIASDFFTGLDYWRTRLSRQTLTPWLIHGGTARQEREKATVLPWNDLGTLIDGIF